MLIGRPHRSRRLAFASVGALIGAVGVGVLLNGNPLGAVLAVLGLYGLSECWRRVTVSGNRLVAQGRLTRRDAELSALGGIGVSPSADVWVAPRNDRAFYLRMVGDEDGSSPGVREFVDQLRERAVAAGALLENGESEQAAHAPHITSPWFSS